MNKVNEIIAEHLNLDVSEVTDDKHLIDDLGADSLHTVELVMKFEEEFNFAILDEDADGLDTVVKIKEYIEENA